MSKTCDKYNGHLYLEWLQLHALQLNNTPHFMQHPLDNPFYYGFYKHTIHLVYGGALCLSE